MDGTDRLTDLERRCADLERLNAQLARDVAAARNGGAPPRPLGAAAAALHVSELEQRLDDTARELALARVEAEAGWGRYYELRGRRIVRLGLWVSRGLRR